MEQEIPAGYKQTEVGVIPEDWDVKPLGAVLSNARLGGNYPNRTTESSMPLMKMGNIGRGAFELSHIQFIPPGVTLDSRHRLFEGDVLFNTRNTLDLVGKVAIWKCKLPLAYYNSNLLKLEFDPSLMCSNGYANYALNTTSSITRLRELATGTTSVAAIYTRDLMRLDFIVPPKHEQRAIADALGDVDALLDALDRQIAKQRDLKQAAMQQLLTGRTRLPGFTGEWVTRRLGELGAAYGGLVGKTKDDFGVGDGRYIPFVNVMANTRIDIQALGRVRVGSAEIQNIVHAGDLVFNGSSETPEEVAMCSVLEAEVPNLFLNSFCFGFRFLDTAAVDSLLLSYYFRADVGRALISSLAQGSTRYNISKSAFLKATVCLPAQAEQTAIATVLSDLDAEVAALEARRAKTADLKQAMLQELLTGRTRLV